MDRFLLKNIIIIILLLVNGFLLASLTIRETARYHTERQAMEQLTALFAADNMTLSQDAISDQKVPPSLSLVRSRQQEQSVAAFFLGHSMVLEDQGGGTYTYTSSAGQARFRSNGSFNITGVLSAGGAQEVLETFCGKFSFDEPSFALDETNSGTASAVCVYNKLPVFNSSVTFTLDHGLLTEVSGILLPPESSIFTETREPLSALAALTSFQTMRRETFAVVSSIMEVYPCYELQSTTTSSLSLVPVWCIVTDISHYYVNSITGAVTSE